MSTEQKTFTVILNEINDAPDGGEAGLCAQLEAGLLRMIREYRASAGMSQLFVVSCEEQGD